ncbi:MAG: cytosine deaminase [Bosea sp. (in: a-proteobacteria)]
MQTGFADVPRAPAFRLINARSPLCLVEAPSLAADRDGLTQIDLTISGGKITSVLAAGTGDPSNGLPTLDLKGGMVFPRFVEAHTHLDKGHIWPRRRNPDGTFMGALANVMADREAKWNAADIKARMEFGLKSALAHGTGAIRTHLDSVGPQIAISWPVFEEVRAEWAGRIALQATPLFGIDNAVNPDHIRDVVAAIKRHGSGILGAVTYMGPNLKTGLEVLFQAAIENGFDLDFHVDETNDPAAQSLEVIADTAIAMGFQGKILCGHCCSLALQMPQAEARIIDKVARAGIAVVSLPMCNMYLQDRTAGRTPRWRGVTLLHELKKVGVPVMVSSDNTRDPFYAYGDLDMLEVYREATRILQLDHSDSDWPAAITTTPAGVMQLDDGARIATSGAADLVLTRARSLTELLSRPQADRTVLIAGEAIDTTLPDYAELDHLMSP